VHATVLQSKVYSIIEEKEIWHTKEQGIGQHSITKRKFLNGLKLLKEKRRLTQQSRLDGQKLHLYTHFCTLGRTTHTTKPLVLIATYPIGKMISKGGDTDTNACIVGGLIGAKLGFSELTKQMPHQCSVLFNFDATVANQKRPEIFTPKEALSHISKLVQLAPEKLELGDNN